MRRPIRSHVANRRMFQGGGLSPFPRPTGILASSQPLVDQVAQNTINPNRTMPMNQGGAARFNNGGMVWDKSQLKWVPRKNTLDSVLNAIGINAINRGYSNIENLASGERPSYNVEDNW